MRGQQGQHAGDQVARRTALEGLGEQVEEELCYPGGRHRDQPLCDIEHQQATEAGWLRLPRQRHQLPHGPGVAGHGLEPLPEKGQHRATTASLAVSAATLPGSHSARWQSRPSPPATVSSPFPHRQKSLIVGASTRSYHFGCTGQRPRIRPVQQAWRWCHIGRGLRIRPPRIAVPGGIRTRSACSARNRRCVASLVHQRRKCQASSGIRAVLAQVVGTKALIQEAGRLAWPPRWFHHGEGRTAASYREELG